MSEPNRREIELLAIGDMHLGRRPAGLPASLALDGERLGPTEAWRRTVSLAIERRVDIVALAGDLVEREDDFFEAYRELRDGVGRLAENGIAVCGVAGNHDVMVLPRLADELDHFRLLGRDGRWEAWTTGPDHDGLTLHGWSFPDRQVRVSPLADGGPGRRPGLNLGLLHCDRDAHDSPYAPVSSAQLRSAGLDGWLLGHIHRPDALTVDLPHGYLGSLSGLHPGETGPRGPWQLSIANGRLVHVEQHALAPLHWQRLDLDLSDLENPEAARSRLLERLGALEREVDAHRVPPDAVGLRIRLTGRTRLAGAVRDLLESEFDHNLSTTRERNVFLERLESRTRPPEDLHALAERTDHAGLLARRLLLLERDPDDPDRRALIEKLRARLRDPVEQPRWRGLEALELDDRQVAEWIAETGSRLLERLLAQRGERQ